MTVLHEVLFAGNVVLFRFAGLFRRRKPLCSDTDTKQRFLLMILNIDKNWNTGYNDGKEEHCDKRLTSVMKDVFF